MSRSRPYNAFYDDNDPWGAAEIGIETWLDGFHRDYSHLEVDPNAPYEEQEDAKETNEAIDVIQAVCSRATALYRTMLSQQVTPDVAGMLDGIGAVPIQVAGFDARRLRLTPDVDVFWHHLELALLRDVLAHLQRRPAKDRHLVYQALFIAANESAISPIAAWYLERAARLLLYGLDVECVAMCRAVLDAALKYKIADEDLDRVKVDRRGWNPDRKEKDFDLAGRILGAKRLGIFSSDEMKRANTIRLDGNEVLHPDDAERFDRVKRDLNARGRVLDLSALLRKLFPM